MKDFLLAASLIAGVKLMIWGSDPTFMDALGRNIVRGLATVLLYVFASRALRRQA